MPTATPHSTAVRVAPSRCASERPAARQLGVEQRHLQRGLRHRVALHPGQSGRDALRGNRRREQERPEELPDHGLRATHPLGRVERLARRHTLAPAFTLVGRDPHDERVALVVGTERGPERAYERQPHPPQLDLPHPRVGHGGIVADGTAAQKCRGPGPAAPLASSALCPIPRSSANVPT